MKKINRTYLMGIICLVFAAFIVWQTGKIPTRLVSNEPGPKMFPYISAAGIAIMAVLSMIFDGKKEKEQEKEQEPYLDKAGWKRLIAIMAVCVLFCIGMQVIGFWITAMIGMFAFIWLLKRDKKINIPFAVILSIGLASLCYFGFTRGFNIPLPKGAVWDLLNIKML